MSQSAGLFTTMDCRLMNYTSYTVSRASCRCMLCNVTGSTYHVASCFKLREKAVMVNGGHGMSYWCINSDFHRTGALVQVLALWSWWKMNVSCPVAWLKISLCENASLFAGIPLGWHAAHPKSAVLHHLCFARKKNNEKWQTYDIPFWKPVCTKVLYGFV